MLVLALLILPFAFVLCVAILTPPQYSNTFVGALDEKYERLHSIEEDKIVVVGGSSVAFGLDSQLVEEWTDMPVVNFGLYAALGTKLMLDLSRSAISAGDVVVIAPELDPQTLSLYFSSEQTLNAIDGNFSMFWDIANENKFSVLGGMWDLATDKLKRIASGELLNPDGVYNSASLNEYGDVIYPRPENVMEAYYDENTKILLSREVIDEAFVDYLNEYIAFCKERGATVIFSWCPMNELAVEIGEEFKSASEFSDYLDSILDCDVYGDINNYIMDAGYFYDTNYHLNDSGVIKRSVELARDVLFALEIPRAVLVDVPEAPALPNADTKFDGEDINSIYFTYEQRANGSYKITGLSAEGLKRFSVTIPLGYNGYKVTAIGEGAFSKGSLSEVIIPEDTNIRIIENGAFSGASTISKLTIYYPVADDIIPPVDFFGTNSDFKIYVPQDSNYDVQYNWVEVKAIKRILTHIKVGE